PPVFCREALKAAVSQNLDQVAWVEGESGVAFAGECEHGIWSQPDGAIHAAGQVDSQEWKGWVRDRVDHRPDPISLFWPQDVIIASKGDDAGVRRGAGHRRDPVAIQSGTGDEVTTLDRAK